MGITEWFIEQNFAGGEKSQCRRDSYASGERRVSRKDKTTASVLQGGFSLGVSGGGTGNVFGYLGKVIWLPFMTIHSGEFCHREGNRGLTCSIIQGGTFFFSSMQFFYCFFGWMGWRTMSQWILCAWKTVLSLDI